VVNLAGSFLLGFYLARRERANSRRTSLQFWAIGVFGSFTTFSAFSIDLVRLLEDGQHLTAASYLCASLIGGLALAHGGQRIGAAIG
jgi:CrcB protein